VLIFLDEERFLEEAVSSVRAQTLTDWELILVDDGSTDRSTTIARDFAAQDNRIRYVEHPGHANRGMAASRNVGAAHTNAPFLAFLDADDVWVREKLAEQVQLLESMPDVAMVNGAGLNWWTWNPASARADVHYLIGGVADRRLDPPEAALAIKPLGRGATGTVDLLIRRNIFDAVGGFDARFRGMYEDQSLYLKVFLRYPVYISSRVWLLYRQHPASCRAQMTGFDYWRLRRVFLDWLRDDIEQLGNARVAAAYRRARRRNQFEAVKAHVPQRYKDHVRDALRRVRREEFRVGH
jgi:glycosyltransferase involved in cell wall biosynthesis